MLVFSHYDLIWVYILDAQIFYPHHHSLLFCFSKLPSWLRPPCSYAYIRGPFLLLIIYTSKNNHCDNH
jgi:hypothetical protein